MKWSGISVNPQYLNLATAFVALILVIVWVLKIRNIEHARAEIVQVEGKLSKGQELWKNFPPLSPREKQGLQKTQERLFRMLPREKDVPAVLEDVSRVARDYNLSNLSVSTADEPARSTAGQPGQPVSGAVRPVAPQASPPAVNKGPEGSDKIGSFPIRMTFSADYQEVAYFLEALQKIPRVVTIQSLQLQRGVPLIVAEVVLQAYYQKGDLPAGAR